MSKTNHKKRSTSQKLFSQRILPWLVLAILLFAVGLIVGNMKTAEDNQTPVGEDGTAPLATRDVILYFAAEDARTLVAESAVINDCAEDDECLRDIVQALIDGPNGGLSPVLPRQSKLLGVHSEGSLITLDFGRELVTAHPGGTQSELLTIYALADTLTANFPHLCQLQILVEGATVETIRGHVDLRQPIYPDFSFVEEGNAPLGEIGPLPDEGRGE